MHFKWGTGIQSNSDIKYALSAKQMTRFGAMISIYQRTDTASVHRALETFTVFALPESHFSVEPCPLNFVRCWESPDYLVRPSVGIESAETHISDLSQALENT
jgi:cystathionine beta-lyase/cystathionine gamma-synthase